MPIVDFDGSSIRIDGSPIKKIKNVNFGWSFNKRRDKFYYHDSINICSYDLLSGETTTISPNRERETLLYVDPQNDDRLYVIVIKKVIKFYLFDLTNNKLITRNRSSNFDSREEYLFLGCSLFPHYMLIFTINRRDIRIDYFFYENGYTACRHVNIHPETNSEIFCDDKAIYYSDKYRDIKLQYQCTNKDFSIGVWSRGGNFKSPIQNHKISFPLSYQILPLLRIFKLLSMDHPLVFDNVVVFEIVSFLYPKIKQSFFQILLDYVNGPFLNKEGFDRFLLNSLMNNKES